METNENYTPTLSGMAYQLQEIQEMLNIVMETGKRPTIISPLPKREMSEKAFLDLLAERLLNVQMDLDTIQERIKPLI